MTIKTSPYALAFFLVELSTAQETTPIIIDSSTISKKEFTKNIAETYSSNAFSYNENIEQSQNYLLRAINWFFGKINDIFGVKIDPQFLSVVEVLIYVILIVIASYIIIRLFADTKAMSFFTKESKELAPIYYEEDHIEHINLDHLIKEALLQNDLRLVIRYRFLKTLKELSIKNLIDWHFEKTNNDYQKELKTGQLQDSFSSVSYLYEHIWYGEFNLDQQGYDNAIKEFEILNHIIKNNG